MTRRRSNQTRKCHHSFCRKLNALSHSCFTQPIVQSLVQVDNQQNRGQSSIDIKKPAEVQLKELKDKMQQACANKTNQEYCVAK